MSRSYREPWYMDSYGTRYRKYMKRYSNKKVRKAVDVPDGKAYRKILNPYDITDWKSRWDPHPHYFYHFNGELDVILPDPEWKARRK